MTVLARDFGAYLFSSIDLGPDNAEAGPCRFRRFHWLGKGLGPKASHDFGQRSEGVGQHLTRQ